MEKSDRDLNRRIEDVRLYHPQHGELGTGVLHLSERGLSHVSFAFSERVPPVLEDGSRFDVVKAVTHQGETFTLCECTVNWLALYADYVIEADVDVADFDSISVRYSDVSEWFLHWQRVKGTVGESLTWTEAPNAIDVTIKTGDEHFSLRSEYIASSNQRGEDLVLHEHIEFVFSAKDHRFSLADLKEKAHSLSCCLSILLAYPVTISSVKVSQKSGYFRRVHYPTFERPERDDEDASFWIQCFIQQPALDAKWQSILDSYHRSQYRKVCWTRLAGMQRYEGFWEYKILGYVSLLDRYLDIRFEGAKSTSPADPSKKKIELFRQNLASELSAATDALREQIIEIATRSFASDGATFADRYHLAAKETDLDVAKIINLSAEDFRFIKKIRDKIAHGDDPGLRPGEYPRAARIQGKIELLLTYWAFQDFSLTTQEFIACLNRTHSKLKRYASIDEIHLSRITGSAEFFHVTEEKLQILRDIKKLRVFGCCTQDECGDLHFSESYTQKFEQWQNDTNKSSGLANPEEIFCVSKDKARVVGHGYFECDDERLEVHHMWVIKNY